MNPYQSPEAREPNIDWLDLVVFAFISIACPITAFWLFSTGGKDDRYELAWEIITQVQLMTWPIALAILSAKYGLG